MKLGKKKLNIQTDQLFYTDNFISFLSVKDWFEVVARFMCEFRVGEQGFNPPPENYKHFIGFLSNSGPDPLKNYKATEPASNVGPPSARQRNAI